MSFSPFEMSVKDIFSGDNRYKIPNFQRDFSWENENFNDFFEDLFKSSGITLTNTIVKPENKYFFGMVLLLGDKSTPDVNVPYEVVDGQQRLTTMTLFFSAIQDIIKENDKEYITEFEDRLFCKSTRQGKVDQLQRLVNNSLDPILPVSILNLNELKDMGAGAGVKPKSYEQDWLLSAFEYIKQLLNKENFSSMLNINPNELNTSSYINILDGLGNHLSNATMICIYHKDKKEANKLFRNLNYRGKPLSQSDLIKNEIFSIIEDDSKFASSVWKEIEDNIYASGEGLQNFIYHYMFGRYQKIKKNNMFEKFLINIKANKKEYIAFINSLKTASFYYKLMLIPRDNDKIFNIINYFRTDNNVSIKRNLEFFKSIEISQYRILLLTLFECRNENVISNTLFRDFINQIARHQSLHVLVSSSPNKLTSIYAKASRAFVSLLKKDKSKYKIESEGIFKTLKEDLIGKLPDLNIVIDADLTYSGIRINDMKAKDIKSRALIKFILQQLSETEQDKSTNTANDGLGFIYTSTLEHIIDKENIGENIFSIGNILLLERDLHKDVNGNDLKKEMYKESRITKTKKFFEDYPDFNESQIINRKKELLESYFKMVKNG